MSGPLSRAGKEHAQLGVVVAEAMMMVMVVVMMKETKTRCILFRNTTPLLIDFLAF